MTKEIAEKEGPTIPKIPVGLAKPLYERVRERAKASKRSITGEVEFELEFYELVTIEPTDSDSETEKTKGEMEKDV